MLTYFLTRLLTYSFTYLAQLYLHDPDESMNQYLQTYDPDASAARAKEAGGGKREL